MPPRRSPAVWVLVALLGLVLAAGVTLAASRLTSQRVGLSSEPLTIGEELVPAAPPSSTTTTTPPRTTTAPVVTVPSGDDGGDDRRGRGRGGDDD